ncbi:MAG: adenylate kinase family protein [Candidatus Bathyarchaeota archaeon]|nr:adenylate kinase family protein [Candidatus Bathyarchaeota archaeon]
MSNLRNTILITGVPGVGKTTVSRLLAESMGWQLVNISELAEVENLTTGFDSIRGTSVVDMEGMRERLAAIIERAEAPIVVESHFAYDVVPPERVSHAFVLRRSPWILKEELEARGYPRDKVWENVEAELIDICLVEAVRAMGEERVFEIDTTERQPTEIAEEITSVIRGMRPRGRSKVDWLGREETRGLLEGRDVRRG